MHWEYNVDTGLGWTQWCDLGAAVDLGCIRLRRLSLGGALDHVSHILLLKAVG